MNLFYPWQWLAVVEVVIAMMVAGAGWLYQKNGEWYVRATHDSARLSPVHTPESSADPAANSAVPVVQQTSAPSVESDPEFAGESLDAIRIHPCSANTDRLGGREYTG